MDAGRLGGVTDTFPIGWCGATEYLAGLRVCMFPRGFGRTTCTTDKDYEFFLCYHRYHARVDLGYLFECYHGYHNKVIHSDNTVMDVIIPPLPQPLRKCVSPQKTKKSIFIEEHAQTFVKQQKKKQRRGSMQTASIQNGVSISMSTT